MKHKKKRGDCSKCLLAAVCLSNGVEGLLKVVNAICPHCLRAWWTASNGREVVLDLGCREFDDYYGYYHNNARINTCSECVAEIREVIGIADGVTGGERGGTSGSTKRRKS